MGFVIKIFGNNNNSKPEAGLFKKKINLHF